MSDDMNEKEIDVEYSYDSFDRVYNLKVSDEVTEFCCVVLNEYGYPDYLRLYPSYNYVVQSDSSDIRHDGSVYTFHVALPHSYHAGSYLCYLIIKTANGSIQTLSPFKMNVTIGAQDN